VVDITKFLCGINSPIFVKLNVRKIPHFGMLEEHSFLEVKSWVQGEAPLLFLK